MSRWPSAATDRRLCAQSAGGRPRIVRERPPLRRDSFGCQPPIVGACSSSTMRFAP
jgi:hypothetical protein